MKGNACSIDWWQDISMRRFSRIFWLLLCLVVIANGGAAAAFPATGTLGLGYPEAEDETLLDEVPLAGLNADTAVSLSPERAETQYPSTSLFHFQHHHRFHHSGAMFGAVPATLPVLASCHARVTLPICPVFSSVVAAPPVHPPRDRG